jgi:hypothetical protein
MFKCAHSLSGASGLQLPLAGSVDFQQSIEELNFH